MTFFSDGWVEYTGIKISVWCIMLFSSLSFFFKFSLKHKSEVKCLSFHLDSFNYSPWDSEVCPNFTSSTVWVHLPRSLVSYHTALRWCTYRSSLNYSERMRGGKTRKTRTDKCSCSPFLPGEVNIFTTAEDSRGAHLQDWQLEPDSPWIILSQVSSRKNWREEHLLDSFTCMLLSTPT